MTETKRTQPENIQLEENLKTAANAVSSALENIRRPAERNETKQLNKDGKIR